jgi:phage shock protein A
MKARLVNEQIRFNFKEAPYKKYQSRQGISRPPVENPRKKSQGLTPEEEEIVQRHEKTISDLEYHIELKEDEIIELNSEIDQLSGEEQDPEEVEQFDSDVIQRFGWNALDILNSGISKEEKVKRLDALTPTKDEGDQELRDIVDDYDYYHPDEEDNEEEIQELEDQKAGIRKQIEQLENRVEKLRTKIYNLETY